MMDEREGEKFKGCNEIMHRIETLGGEVHALALDSHGMDRRLVAVETRSTAIERQIEGIHSEVGEIRAEIRIQNGLMKDLTKDLSRHMIEETKGQKKVMFYIITTLVSVILAGAANYLKYSVFLGGGP